MIVSGSESGREKDPRGTGLEEGKDSRAGQTSICYAGSLTLDAPKISLPVDGWVRVSSMDWSPPSAWFREIFLALISRRVTAQFIKNDKIAMYVSLVFLSRAGGLTVVGAFVVEFESKKGVLDRLVGQATVALSLPHNTRTNQIAHREVRRRTPTRPRSG